MKCIFYVIIAALALTACQGKRNTVPKPVEDFITNLYANYVFAPGDLDSIAANFSPALLDSLRKAYDDEYCDGGPAYAVWLFRTGQNGSDDQTLDSIKADGNDLYTAYITDGGTPCACRMHIVMTDGKPVLTDFHTTYDDPAAADLPARSLVPLSELQGEWRVVAVNNDGSTWTTVTMTFDTAAGTFSLNASCNSIGGNFAQIERSADALRFDNIATTQMSCGEDLDRLERQLLDALPRVRSFYALGPDIVFASADDAPLLRLSRPITNKK